MIIFKKLYTEAVTYHYRLDIKKEGSTTSYHIERGLGDDLERILADVRSDKLLNTHITSETMFSLRPESIESKDWEAFCIWVLGEVTS